MTKKSDHQVYWENKEYFDRKLGHKSPKNGGNGGGNIVLGILVVAAVLFGLAYVGSQKTTTPTNNTPLIEFNEAK